VVKGGCYYFDAGLATITGSAPARPHTVADWLGFRAVRDW